jgi:PEP-CTERM motif-containing protein
MFRRWFGGAWIVFAVALLGVALIATATPAQADTFTFNSCHITGGCPSTGFGTVTLTQSGTSVTFDVVLNNGNRFVETGAGGDSLFLFNDSIAGSTITGITTTLNGSTVTVIPGGVSGATNQPAIMADGTGTFTAHVFCTVASDCNGGSTPTFNDLHFTVTNATLAQLETANANGNLFVADILCGATQTGCTTGLTGPVDVSGVVPEPTTLLMVGTALLGLGGAWRRRRSQRALALAV